jgi:hypothetical protein
LFLDFADDEDFPEVYDDLEEIPFGFDRKLPTIGYFI